MDLTPFQWILLGLLLVGAVQYLWLLWEQKYSRRSGLAEGFTSQDTKATDADSSRHIWYDEDELFDDFYASVYDNLTQLAGRYPQELALIMTQWKKKAEPDTMEILDVGCGTGIASVLFARQGVKSIVGLDKSESMLRRARNVTTPAADLTQDQKDGLQFIQGDMMREATFPGGQFSHAALMFFSVYYTQDHTTLFKNLYHWVRPGGKLAVEVVNKYKFDPLLESATPFAGLSLQKYAKKERFTKSKVEFDKFSYEAEFDLQDPTAEFRETFRFKDGSVRRQKHTLYMRDIKDLVHAAQSAGWTYDGNIDLTLAGFEYAYVLMFTHP
jgi:SAM-dependent methyltransferase